MSNKFWNIEVPTTSLRTPLAILHEVAEELKLSTHGALLGHVVSESPHGNFYLTFSLRFPAQRYSLRLFKCLHSPYQYPVWVFDRELLQQIISDSYLEGSLEAAKKSESPEEFESIVQEILNTDHVRKTVHGLLAASIALSEVKETLDEI